MFEIREKKCPMVPSMYRLRCPIHCIIQFLHYCLNTTRFREIWKIWLWDDRTFLFLLFQTFSFNIIFNTRSREICFWDNGTFIFSYFKHLKSINEIKNRKYEKYINWGNVWNKGKEMSHGPIDVFPRYPPRYPPLCVLHGFLHCVYLLSGNELAGVSKIITNNNNNKIYIIFFK